MVNDKNSIAIIENEVASFSSIIESNFEKNTHNNIQYNAQKCTYHRTAKKKEKTNNRCVRLRERMDTIPCDCVNKRAAFIEVDLCRVSNKKNCIHKNCTRRSYRTVLVFFLVPNMYSLCTFMHDLPFVELFSCAPFHSFLHRFPQNCTFLNDADGSKNAITTVVATTTMRRNYMMA